jgi:hypothetical protein
MTVERMKNIQPNSMIAVTINTKSGMVSANSMA